MELNHGLFWLVGHLFRLALTLARAGFIGFLYKEADHFFVFYLCFWSDGSFFKSFVVKEVKFLFGIFVCLRIWKEVFDNIARGFFISFKLLSLTCISFSSDLFLKRTINKSAQNIFFIIRARFKPFPLMFRRT